jgi:transposase
VALRRTSGRQRINLHGALNLENFHCPLVQAEKINAASAIALFEMLEATNPDKRWIYVIADNARYHHARLVRQWLERPGCRNKLIFLPAYAPHLNAIERLWGVMHREVTPQHLLPQFRPLHRGHRRLLPTTTAPRVAPMARHNHRQLPCRLPPGLPPGLSGSGVGRVYKELRTTSFEVWQSTSTAA